MTPVNDLETYIPMRVVSCMNLREHWATRKKRVSRQRGLVKLHLAGYVMPFADRYEVKLTRVAPRTMDGDNLQSGFKAVRDEVAAWLGIDDGSPRITWVYEQQKGKVREYAAIIRVEARAA